MHHDIDHDIKGYDWNEGEPDHEGEMALGQLHRICDMSEMLMNIIDENDELPGWVQFKLDRAYNDMTDLFAYIESKSHDELPDYDEDGMMMTDIDAESMNEAKKKGLWHNIRARRKKGKPRLKPGQKGYPKTLNIGK